jgi:ribosome assembly protein 4
MAGPEGSFKARFLDGDGNQVCDVIEVPLADASEKNLSLLLNTLLARVGSGAAEFAIVTGC